MIQRTFYSRKRWGHGRLLQLAVQWWHNNVRDHDWTAWHYDWPEDYLLDDMDLESEERELEREFLLRGPQPNTPLVWLRTCSHADCHIIQEARVSLAEAHRLPGRTRGCVFSPAQSHD